jgi:photosystem II stability/assembly factor-like uncharacterized protein
MSILGPTGPTGPTGSEVATITSGASTSNPTFLFNSYGTFYIDATVSSNSYYTETTLTSLQITVSADLPNIEISSCVYISYTYGLGKRYDYEESAASITNDTGQQLIYQVVTADSTPKSITVSPLATIDPSGNYLNIITCGNGRPGNNTFRIYASVIATSNGDFGKGSAFSEILTIQKETPTIHRYPQIILPPGVTTPSLVYGESYPIIPDLTDPSQISTITSNTDNPGPNITYSTYSTTDSSVAKISGSTVKIVAGIGQFQIVTNVSATTNYTQVPFSSSCSTQVYETTKAVPTIRTFPTIPQTLGYGMRYTIPSGIITTNTDISGNSLVTYASSDTNIATISGNTISGYTIKGEGVVNGTGSGNYQILVTIAETSNFNAVTYSYPSGLLYKNPPPPGVIYTSYNTEWTIPTIQFPPTFQTSSMYLSTYNFVAPILSNNDSSQTLTYSIPPQVTTNAVFDSNSISIGQVISVPINSPLIGIEAGDEIKITYPSTDYIIGNCTSVSTTQIVVSILQINNAPSNSIATLLYQPGVANPSVVINSVGTFKIQASCLVSNNGFYSSQTATSPLITIANEIPIIAFDTSHFGNSAITLSPDGNWTCISLSSNGQYQSAVVNGGSIYTSNDYGSTWVANTSESTPTSANWSSVSISSASGQYQSAVVNGGSIYTSNDYGQTWTQNTSANTPTTANWNSISLSSTGQYQTAVASNGSIYTSPDSGQTWTPNTSAPSGVNWWDSVSISSTGQYQTAVVNGGSIYTSLDSGNTWTPNASAPTGVIWNSVSISSTGQYQSAVVNGGSIYTSLDSGKTWIPNTSAPTGVNWNSISLNSTGEYQSAVVNGGSIYTSNDNGLTWSQITSGLPSPSALWVSIAISSSGQYQSAVVNGGSIYFSSDYGVTWSDDASVSYIYTSTPYTFASSTTLASVKNNTLQIPSYSIVDASSNVMINSVMSPVATISSDGTIINLISVGSFRILATATASSSPNFDYGGASVASELITVLPATPTLTTNLSQIPSSWEYNTIYPIPYPQTTNTDLSSNLIVTYSTDYPNIISISGTNITINDLGYFNIKVSIASTTNFNAAPNISITSYTASQATPSISLFPSYYGSGWVDEGQYNLTNTATPNTLTSSIIYTIINSNPSGIATISSSTLVTISGTGTFQIQADLAATTYYTSANSVQSNPITISPLNPQLYGNNFTGWVYGGGSYPLSVTTSNNDPGLAITYTINNGIATISGSTITVVSAGTAYITVSLSATANFSSWPFPPISVSIAKATPNVVMNSSWINTQIHTLTIGSTFGVYSLFTTNSNTDPGVTYSLSPTIVNGIGTVSIQNNTVYCNSPGTFSLIVTSNATTNFQAYSFQTPNFYVSVVPEVIIFNNPTTWPPTTLSEVGMAICITPDSYPFGFNNYSALTISNYGSQGSFTLNSTTTPTYNSVIYKYMVFFEPATASIFSYNLSTSTASNIALVTINSIASGISGPAATNISNGQYLIFTFSGDTSGDAPDPLSIGWNPGGINIQPGQVFGAYYPYANNITPPQNLPNGTGVTVSTLNSGSISGYFIAPWAGYGVYLGMSGAYYNTCITNGILNPNTPLTTSQVTLTLQQAWGIWTNINYGDQFGSTLTLDNVNYYYVGIPQLTNPITYYP